MEPARHQFHGDRLVAWRPRPHWPARQEEHREERLLQEERGLPSDDREGTDGGDVVSRSRGIFFMEFVTKACARRWKK